MSNLLRSRASRNGGLRERDQSRAVLRARLPWTIEFVVCCAKTTYCIIDLSCKQSNLVLYSMQRISEGFQLLLILISTLSLANASTQSSKGRGDGIDQSLFSYNLMKDENHETHKTKLFRHQSSLLVRHDLDFRVELQPLRKLQQRLCDEPFTFKLTEDETDPAIFTWTQRPIAKRQGELLFQLHVNRSIPVGKYVLTAKDPCSYIERRSKTVQLDDVYVLFNPQSGDKIDLRS